MKFGWKPLPLAAASLALAACGTTTADAGLSSASAVGELHSRAEQSLAISWRIFDALLTAVDALQQSGVVKSGSPAALKLATLIERTRAALDEATAALRKGDGAGFAHSLTLAQSALDETKAAIGNAA
jgi:hypothetical protein